MKVKFLRNYGENKIGIITDIEMDEQEKDYLVKTNTVEILEEDKAVEEIPVIEPAEQQKSAKKNSKKEAANE